MRELRSSLTMKKMMKTLNLMILLMALPLFISSTTSQNQELEIEKESAAIIQQEAIKGGLSTDY